MSSQANKTVSESTSGKLQLFLGGSCNPTTWRQNVAIPFLEMNGISYYNPQVDNWTPEVVDSERYAKQNAQILLFVIDKQTRSTVSLVESAFMAGQKRNLVLVIYPLSYNIFSIQDTSKQASKSIESRSRLTETRCSSKKGLNESFMESSCSETSSSTLISSTSILKRDNLNQASSHSYSCSKTTLTAAQANNTKGISTREADLRKSDETHDKAKQTSGAIKLSDEIISFFEFQELRQARYILQNLVGLNKIPMYSDILQALDHVSCRLNDHTRLNQGLTQMSSHNPAINDDKRISLICSPDSKQSITNKTEFDQSTETNTCYTMKDVYLSLDCDDHTNFEHSVKSILEEQGLTYNYMSVNSVIDSSDNTVVLPKLSNDSQMSIENTNHLTRYSGSCEHTKLAIEKAFCTIKCSRVLLFVITNRCRGLSIMVLASHFMALFRDNVVLCVQYLEEPCSIGGETLSKTAIADYNRGRVYLCDYAIKSQVPVFSNVREAVECCGRKCRLKNKNC